MPRPATSKANRGRRWEEVLTASFATTSDCSIVKTSAPVRVVRWPRAGVSRGEFTGFFEAKATADYEGGWRGMACSLEAKSTQAERLWSFNSAISAHQMDRLRQCDDIGGLAGVLLRWEPGAVRGASLAIAYWRLRDWMQSGVSSVELAGLLDAARFRESGVCEMMLAGYHRGGMTVDVEAALHMLDGFRRIPTWRSE